MGEAGSGGFVQQGDEDHRLGDCWRRSTSVLVWSGPGLVVVDHAADPEASK